MAKKHYLIYPIDITGFAICINFTRRVETEIYSSGYEMLDN